MYGPIYIIQVHNFQFQEPCGNISMVKDHFITSICFLLKQMLKTLRNTKRNEDG
jgi:hypothetical protein